MEQRSGTAEGSVRCTSSDFDGPSKDLEQKVVQRLTLCGLGKRTGLAHLCA